MKSSTDRILTTHVGSLFRPNDLLEMMRARESGKPVDEEAYAARLRSAVAEVVGKQAEHGLDIVSDGEQGKLGFNYYAGSRLSGFEPRDAPIRRNPALGTREYLSFPDFYEEQLRSAAESGVVRTAPRVCTGPVSYTGHAELRREIENFKAALGSAQVEEAFMPSISPANVENVFKNEYYATEEEYQAAIAEAMREEYRTIVEAGLLLQVDDPQLVTYYIRHPELSVEQCRRWAEQHVEILNHALRGLPPDRIRFHTCYSIDTGPRVHDMELKNIVDVILKVNAGAYSFEAANPRHEHEWRVWETVKLPEGKRIIPGVITQSTPVVEHPELVAERIVRFARVVGRENVIAGADCGFATMAGSTDSHESIAWAKFDSLVQGGRIATKELWGHAA